MTGAGEDGSHQNRKYSQSIHRCLCGKFIYLPSFNSFYQPHQEPIQLLMSRTSMAASRRKQQAANFITTSLSEKIVECWLRQNDDRYQHLLIKAKELELEILEQQAVQKSLDRAAQLKVKQIRELKLEHERIQKQSLQKKLYLSNYYQHLDSKLKSGPLPASLFSSLEAMEKNLGSQFENQRNQLENGIVELRNMATSLSNQLAYLENRKFALKEEYQLLKSDKEAQRSEEELRRNERRQRIIKEREQYDSISKRRKELADEKERLENEEKVLKKLLNLEETHQKHWLVIQNSIKREFSAKVKENHYKEALGMEYELKIPELQSKINQNKMQCNELEQNLIERKQKLEELKQQVNANIEKYRHLEGEMPNRRSTN